MKVTVKNLGIIKDAEIELKPLTVLIGPNNSGKTWLAYTLAGILGPYGWSEYARAYISEEVQDKYPPLDTAIQKVIDEGSAKINLVQFISEYGETYFNNVALYMKNNFADFMGSERISFDDLTIGVNLAKTQESLQSQIVSASFEIGLSAGRRRTKPVLTALKEAGHEELHMYTATEKNVTNELPTHAFKEVIVNSVFSRLHQALYSYVYTFPTERTVLITIPLQKQTVRISELPTSSRRGLVPWSVGHFVNMVEMLFSSGRAERSKEANQDANLQRYVQLAQILEQQILGGKVDFSTEEPDPRREILFNPNETTSMELSIVSSMVKELSSLVLCLQYLIEPGAWLIIDEPEMNLHPQAQAQIIEFLAMLVNAGLYVLITTHSPYVVDHLANLMEAHKSADHEAIRDKFYLQSTAAFIAKEQVAVYQVDASGTKNILDDDGIIHWDTFSKVSDKVSQIYYDV